MVIYHLHSHDSLLDSTTKFSEYVDLAVAQGMNAIGTTEHGLPRSWVEKKQYADARHIKLIIGVEAYITPHVEERVRNNQHVCLLAKNEDGFHELMRLMEIASREDHSYYNPRLSYEEFLAISPNIIKTSACIASPLARIDPSDPMYLRLAKHFDYLEVQHHNVPEQIAHNKKMLQLSRQLGIPLIAGTDTHSSSQYKAECRRVLLEYKDIPHQDEAWDLVWKNEDELIEAYEKQGALSRNAFMEAIANTQVMADSVEDWKLDTTPKYPVLNGSPEEDEKQLEEITWRMLDEKLDAGIIPREQEEEFRRDIKEELAAFHQTNMSGFMLSMSKIINWCRSTGKSIGPSRGSVSGSRVAYVTGTTDLNPVTWHTNFSRFCNSERVSLADVDEDCIESERPEIFNYIVSTFGEKKCARVASYGTIADLAFVDDCGGGLAIMWEREHHPERFRENGRLDVPSGKKKSDVFDRANPYHPFKLKVIKEEFKSDPERAKDKHNELFYYYDGIIGTRVSQSVHPAGMVISCSELDQDWGVFHKDGERCLLLSMDEVANVFLVKYDLLILKTVQVISDCYKLLSKPYPRMDQIDFCDKKVWDDICADQLGIFQFESEFAADAIRKFKPRSIEEMTVANAALRPGSASYRDELFARKRKKNPTPLLDEILKDSYGQLVYQEQTIEFLQKVCGLSASYADTIRRAISKKNREKIDKAMPAILDGYCKNSDKPRAEAEEEARQFLQVIEDSSLYSFNYNHAVGYSLLSYMCAYLRHYFPEQFVAAYLKNAANDDDIATGKSIARLRGIEMTKPRFRQDNRTLFIDSEHHVLSDSLINVKGIGLKDAEALYDLRDRKYSTFVELLRDMTLYTGALNTAVIEKLIKLNYFEEFGCIKRLLKLYDAFYNGPHCFKTTLVPASQAVRMQQLMAYELGTPDLLGETHSDLDGLVDDPRDIVRYEAELYGEPTSTAPAAKGEYIVLEVDTKYSPRLQLYSVSTGKKGQMKILKKTFEKKPLAVGDWIRIVNWSPKEAYGKPGVIENWINVYDKILF